MLISNIVSLIIFLGVYMYIYKNYPTLIFVFFYLFFGYLSMVVSVFYLDFGGKYSFELSKTSVQSNSLVILTLFYLSTIFLFLLWYRLRIPQFKQYSSLNFERSRFYLKPKFILLFLYATVIYILILYWHLFYSGIPLFLGYGKGEIWLYSKFKFLQPISNQSSTVLLVLGFLFAYIRKYQKDNIAYTKYLFYFKIILIFFICYIILMGYKFGGPLLFLFSFYISHLVFLSFENKFRFRDLAKYIIFFSLFFVSVVWYVYTHSTFNIQGDTWALIFDRIFALQGQMWHFVYNGIVDQSIVPDLSQLTKEFKNIFSNTYSKETGINYVMRLIMPDDRLHSYLSKGVRLSGGYPAILLSISGFNIITLILHILFSYLIFILHFKWLYHLGRFNLIQFILWFKLAFASKNIIFMGDIHVLFSFENMMYLLIIFAIYLFELSLINQKKLLTS